MKFLLLLIIILILNCSNNSMPTREGYCLFHKQKLYSIEDSALVKLSNEFTSMIISNDLNFAVNNIFLYGFNKKEGLFVIYDILSKSFKKKINLKSNNIIFSGYCESCNTIYFSDQIKIYQKNLTNNKRKEIYNFKKFTKEHDAVLNDFFYDKKYNVIYLKLEIKTKKFYSQTLWRINVKINEIKKIADEPNGSISLFKSYKYNQLFYSLRSKNMPIFKIDHNKIQGLKIYNDTQYNFNNIVMDCIDDKTIIFREAKYSLLRDLMNASEASFLVIYNHIIHKKKKLNMKFYHGQSLNYFQDKAVYDFLLEQYSE